MSLEEIKAKIRTVPDFPIKGILFRDFTTVFQDANCLSELEKILVNRYQNLGITKVVGIESRGFIMAPAIATEIGAGFVPIRKKGKLPAETIELAYGKEYGQDIIQIHKDALSKDDVVLLHDDLLATGGTMKAAQDLVKKFGVKKIYINFLVELDDLKGRALFDPDIDVEALMHY
ncbi:MAG: adenine phosphoribosyltransferase [Paludibacteraceae bacterium]|nr:adenine phosphoribosyltransferase [Paludibacteraceae bacterium]